MSEFGQLSFICEQLIIRFVKVMQLLIRLLGKKHSLTQNTMFQKGQGVIIRLLIVSTC